MRFNNFIVEEVAQITHLEHLEDLLINDGLQGFNDFATIVKKTLAGSKDDIVFQVKVDGSPSLFFGIDPLDNKFFISTKSLFNKNPKIAKSPQDVATLFKSEGLQEKLQAAFRYLSKIHINPDIVYQGDIIFTQPDKKMVAIDGISYITFTPNVLTYAVSKALPMYDNIKSAKFGIVVHTMYKISKRTADGFQLATTSYDFSSVTSQSGGDLFVISNVISGAKVDDTQSKDILNALTVIGKVVSNNHVLDELSKRDEKIGIYIKTFVNAQLDRPDLGIFADAKDGKPFLGDGYFGQLFDFCLSSYDKDTSQRDVGDIKMLRDRMYKVMLRSKRDLILFLWCYYQMIKIKYELLSMFSDNEVFSKTFKQQGNKMLSTAPEGIVILSGDRIIKLVDRTEFSKINRMAHR